MSQYTDAMNDLNEAAYIAVRSALRQPGAPVDELKAIAAQIDLLIDHGPALARMAKVNRDD